MKNNLNLLLALIIVAFVSLPSCTKNLNESFDNGLISISMKTTIVGSWHLVEKGIEVAMYDRHMCNDLQNVSDDKMTYVAQWEKVDSNEKRLFYKNGDYYDYINGNMTCKGTYNVFDLGILEINSDCKNEISKIEELPTIFLIMKQGNQLLKYNRLD